ncbi:MAG: OmpA family protein, partial [Geminicoccaceae bacterium]|nr:OmpA family protein [Geminicoccaceae bacterium]
AMRIAELETEVEAGRAAEEHAAELERRIASFDEQNASRNAANEALLEEARARVGELEAELEAVRSQAALDLQAATDDLTARLEAREAEAGAALAQALAAGEASAGRVNELEAELADARSAIAATEAEAPASDEELSAMAGLEQQVDELDRSLTDAQGIIARQALERDEAAAEVRRLREELARAMADSEAARAELTGALDQLASAEDRESAMEQIRAQLQSSQEPVEGVQSSVEAVVAREGQVMTRLMSSIGGAEDVELVSGGKLALDSGVLFASGQAELSDAGRGELNRVAQDLKRIVDQLPDDVPWAIRVDGHTDSEPLSGRGRYRTNWELSTARASSVVRYLVEWGIPRDRIIAAGFADTQPIAEGTSPEAMAQNRRIEIKLTAR